MSINRRDFITMAFGGTLGLLFGGGYVFHAIQLRREFPWTPLALPIQGLKPQELDGTGYVDPISQRRPEINTLGVSFPAPEESAPVVIIGGGMSGLLCTYFLKKYSPVLLEASPQLGGNAQGERIEDLAYSTGDARIEVPLPGGPIEALLKELDLLRFARKQEAGPTLLSGEKSLTPVLQTYAAQISFLLSEAALAYPEGTLTQSRFESSAWTPEHLEKLRKLDALSYAQWLNEKQFKFPKELHTLLETLCRNALGGSPSEVSAAYAIAHLLRDLGPALVYPGGNSAISNTLVMRLIHDLAPRNLRTNCEVIELRGTPEGVQLTYRDHENKLRTLLARVAIIATSKHSTRQFFKDLPEETLRAMDELQPRGQLIANVHFKSKLPSSTYEFFPMEPAGKSFTSGVFQAWAGSDQAAQNGLTLIRPLTSEEEAKALLEAESFTKEKARIQKDLPELCKQLGIPESEISGIRLTRRLRAKHLPSPGLFTRGIFEHTRATIGAKIFFAGEDDWGVSGFESAFVNAHTAAQAIQKQMPI